MQFDCCVRRNIEMVIIILLFFIKRNDINSFKTKLQIKTQPEKKRIDICETTYLDERKENKKNKEG